MPDIITASEQNAIALYLAAGGTITKCPPRFASPVTGAEPMTDGVQSKAREKTAREKWSELAERGKKQKAADRKRKLKLSDEKRARSDNARAFARIRAKEASDRKLGKILRLIDGDWTWARLRAVAKELGYSRPKTMTGFLREHGHGDKIPPRDHTRTVKAAPVKSAEVAARDAGMLADYDAGLRIRGICEKWKTSGRYLRRLVEKRGSGVRPARISSRKTERIASRDAAIRSAYEAGASREELCAKYGIQEKALTLAIRRAGGEVARKKPVRRLGDRR